MLQKNMDGTSWTSGETLNVTRAVNAVGGGINTNASTNCQQML